MSQNSSSFHSFRSFSNPDENTIKSILNTVKTIAIVGLSAKPERPSYGVAAALQKYGYRIVPVNPALKENVLGEKPYASLRDIPFAVDVVDVFRAPEDVGPIVDEAIAIKAPRLWLQEGVINEAEAVRAQAAGLQVVMNRCMWKDYDHLIAGVEH